MCSACGQRYDQGGCCTSDGTQLASTTDPLLGTEVGRYLDVQPRIGSRVAIEVHAGQMDSVKSVYAVPRAVTAGTVCGMPSAP